MRNFYYLILVTFIFISKIYSQNISNLYDINGNLIDLTTLKINTSLSDEFNNPNLDLNKWQVRDNVPEKMFPNNVEINNGKLVITYRNKSETGGIISKRSNYHYGYYESRYKLPFYMKDGVKVSDPIYQVFWLNYDIYNPKIYGELMAHDEIDQFEGYKIQPDGTTKIWHQGIHIMRRPSYVLNTTDPNNAWQAMQSNSIMDTTIDEDLSADFHTYGLLYLPNLLRFYIDGIQINEITNNYSSIENHDFFPIHPLGVYFNGDINVTNENGTSVALAATPWDATDIANLPKYEIDYFRYYEYKASNNSKTISNLFNMKEFKISEQNNSVYNLVTTPTTTTFNISIPIHSNSTYPIGNYSYDGQTYVSPKYYDPYDEVFKNYLIRAEKTVIKPLNTNSKFVVPPGANFQITPTKFTTNSTTLPIIFNKEANSIKIDNSLNVVVFPNPATSFIEINSKNNKIIEFQLYTVDGLKVLENSVNNSYFKFNVANYSKGFYFLQIKLESNELITKKIILK